MEIKQEIALIQENPRRRTFYMRAGKRVCDFVFALLLALLISPLLLVIILALLIFQGGNPFFLQERVGRGYRNFNIIKFNEIWNKDFI